MKNCSDLINLPLIPTLCEPIKCLSSVNQNTIVDYNSTALHEPKLSSQISCAQTLSKNMSDDLEKMVKQVVSDSLRAQKREDKIDVSVIVFGMPESDNDVTIVRKLLDDDDVIDSIVSITRLGKQYASEKKNAKGQPIIVELKHPSDRERVLHNARRLMRGIRTCMAKYLSSSEFDDLKNRRVECHRLNEYTAKLPDGSPKYIVINGHIRARTEDGKLYRYQSDDKASEHNSTVSSTVCCGNSASPHTSQQVQDISKYFASFALCSKYV